MAQTDRWITGSDAASSVATTGNRVLRNTYWLLGMTLMFSALVAGVAAKLGLPAMPWYLMLAGYFGLLFATTKFENSGLGIVFVFALTGFMGYSIGPILNHYLASSQGTEIVMTAFGGTALSFLGMSALAIFSKRDFSFLGKFLFEIGRAHV